jgi:hypothetical protein
MSTFSSLERSVPPRLRVDLHEEAAIGRPSLAASAPSATSKRKEHEMKRHFPILRGLPPTLTALLGLGCASWPQLLATLQRTPSHLEARGPGTLFGSIECAAVDALIYAYLQTQTSRDDRMRGGTIYKAGGGYSYGEIVVAGPLLPDRISYALKPRDVARFHVYARAGGHHAKLTSERPTRSDRRSVRFGDPLHRPLYILHPSLVIREYRGEDPKPVEVASLRRPLEPQRIASALPTRVRIGRSSGLSHVR